jgi:hypothetical protein
MLRFSLPSALLCSRTAQRSPVLVSLLVVGLCRLLPKPGAGRHEFFSSVTHADHLSCPRKRCARPPPHHRCPRSIADCVFDLIAGRDQHVGGKATRPQRDGPQKPPWRILPCPIHGALDEQSTHAGDGRAQEASRSRKSGARELLSHRNRSTSERSIWSGAVGFRSVKRGTACQRPRGALQSKRLLEPVGRIARMQHRAQAVSVGEQRRRVRSAYAETRFDGS